MSRTLYLVIMFLLIACSTVEKEPDSKSLQESVKTVQIKQQQESIVEKVPQESLQEPTVEPLTVQDERLRQLTKLEVARLYFLDLSKKSNQLSQHCLQLVQKIEKKLPVKKQGIDPIVLAQHYEDHDPILKPKPDYHDIVVLLKYLKESCENSDVVYEQSVLAASAKFWQDMSKMVEEFERYNTSEQARKFSKVVTAENKNQFVSTNEQPEGDNVKNNNVKLALDAQKKNILQIILVVIFVVLVVVFATKRNFNSTIVSKDFIGVDSSKKTKPFNVEYYSDDVAKLIKEDTICGGCLRAVMQNGDERLCGCNKPPSNQQLRQYVQCMIGIMNGTNCRYCRKKFKGLSGGQCQCHKCKICNRKDSRCIC